MTEAVAQPPEAALDLVCGPRSVLPETRQRYRLVAHLATGGQAEVYRGVRLSAGVASSPVTVKVFRESDERPVNDQLRSWDKGDAVLADLGVRNVPGICRRVEAFNGPLPYQPGTDPDGHEVPYQILEYLPGWSLRDLAHHSHGQRTVDGHVVLRGLADALIGLHKPPPKASTPVLHMDVTPANVIVLPDGTPRLIDFTGARYDRRDHITSIAFTAQAGGPEALNGQVSSAYDVHGFGAVAYFLVTGQLPREVTESGPPMDPMTVPRARWSVLRPAAELTATPRLAEHLLAPLADEPGDRPRTEDLPGWVDRLTELAGALDPNTFEGAVASWPSRRPIRGSAKVGAAGVGAGAGETVNANASAANPSAANANTAKGFNAGRAAVVGAAGGAAAGAAVGTAAGAAGAGAAGAGAGAAGTAAGGPAAPVPADATVAGVPAGMDGTGLDRTRIDQPGAEPGRVARLEQEVVELRALLRDGRTAPAAPPQPAHTRVQPSPLAPTNPGQPPADRKLRGSSPVRRPEPPRPEPKPGPPPGPAPGYGPPPPLRSGRRRGRVWSVLGAVFLMCCWGLWAAANLVQPGSGGNASLPATLGIGFALAVLAAAAPFWLSRLAGKVVLAERQRAGALPSHLVAATFSVLTGLAFLSVAPPPDFVGFVGSFMVAVPALRPVRRVAGRVPSYQCVEPDHTVQGGRRARHAIRLR